jgi:hypothetical protein
VTQIQDQYKDSTGGRPTVEIKYTAGADKKWFTPDDEVFHYFTAEYNEKGWLTKKTCLKPGTSGIPNPLKDAVQDYTTYEYGPTGRESGESSFSASGSLKYSSEFEYDQEGRKVKEIRHDASGKVIRWIAYEYDKRGNLVKDTEYSSSGPDGQWFTSDDEIEKYHVREYKSGKLIRMSEYHRDQKGTGPDGKWFTSDDVVSSTKEFLYDNQGRMNKVLKATGPGPDKKWFTKDDVLQYYTVRTFKSPAKGK